MRDLQRLARAIDAVDERIGRAVAWLALAMVLVQLVVVVLRYVFGLGWVALQESVIYMHAALFMVAAGYTLLHDGHVRCDIFHGQASPRLRALVDLLGVVVFLLPVATLILWTAWPFVVNAWAVREGSPEGSLGIPGIYLLKSLILVFAVLLILQGLALAIRSGLRLAGVDDDGGRSRAQAPAGEGAGRR
jgi:TRAP-type mannitol/chloroaromatic compound transport system permease small subunit